jgi:hypothetical protein
VRNDVIINLLSIQLLSHLRGPKQRLVTILAANRYRQVIYSWASTRVMLGKRGLVMLMSSLRKVLKLMLALTSAY